MECKTCNYQIKDQWDDGKYPYQYELQIRHYMAVMNLDFAYIACLWGNNENNDFAWRRVERDYEFEDQIIEMEQDFWEEHILKHVEPPFVEKPDMALKCLKSYIGLADPSAGKLTLPLSLGSNVEKYLMLKEKKSKVDAESKQLETEMKRMYLPIVEELGVCCEGEISAAGKKFIITYKPRNKTQIKKEDLEKLQVHHPDIYDEYVSTSESRTFNAKELKVS